MNIRHLSQQGGGAPHKCIRGHTLGSETSDLVAPDEGATTNYKSWIQGWGHLGSYWLQNDFFSLERYKQCPPVAQIAANFNRDDNSFGPQEKLETSMNPPKTAANANKAFKVLSFQGVSNQILNLF